MTQDDNIPDEQDQSETFDETHIDDEGEGNVLLDEADPVPDLTQKEGDAIEDEDDIEDREARDTGSPGTRDPSSPDEVELVYDGLMRNRRGAQASAAHWEARRLDDDDIESLGYGPDSSPDEDDADRSVA